MSGYSYTPPTNTANENVSPPPLPEDPGPLRPEPAPPDTIDNYKAKKPVGWIIAIAGVVIVAIVGVIIATNLPPGPDSTPTPTSTRPAPATPSRTGGLPFAENSVSGYWKITETTWTDTGVRLSVEITVDSGTLYYDFYAYDSKGQDRIAPTWGAPSDLQPGFVGPGQTLVGTISFTVDRQPLTLVMSSRNQTQLSALPVEG